MVDYPNFYENIVEANRRLCRTVVLYDKEPYYVGAITNHKSDGIFRMYLEPLGRSSYYFGSQETITGNYENGDSEIGKQLDACGLPEDILRKKMNSPLFNRFRPFPLGFFYNDRKGASYAVRHPSRRSEQGLVASSISMYSATRALIDDTPEPLSFRHNTLVNWRSAAFADMISGKLYAYPKENLSWFFQEKYKEKGSTVILSRNMACVSGPVSAVFLVYQNTAVGSVTLLSEDKFKVSLGPQFKYLAEVITQEGIFDVVD